MPLNKNLNVAGTIINPATEDTLALMKTAIDNIKTQTDKLKFTGDYLKATIA